ncbi:hypothetical protein JHK82_018994 [Glycine max]|nr:hypothetical protein JHK87_018865 [Glycine soja]KAG5023089.1 hypothetical protein JHK85_019431 [Glycine max]KAG5038173.1 hypothetical protein JHK86_019013 [Glycine max]KAG5143299.1 hypothetical protein JHK82_018994 [Glycine max]
MSLNAKLLAIAQGLQIAWDKGVTSIICEYDSKLVVDMISLGWNFRILHVIREGKACANLLARNGSSSFDKLVIFDKCPFFINVALLSDVCVTLHVKE